MYRDIEERRKFPRLSIKLPLQYKNLERFPDVYVSSISENISKGGACFFCYEFLPLSTRIVVTLSLQEARLLQLKMISKVAWTKKNSPLENYLIGVEFLAMTEEDRHFLNKFMDTTLS